MVFDTPYFENEPFFSYFLAKSGLCLNAWQDLRKVCSLGTFCPFIPTFILKWHGYRTVVVHLLLQNTQL